MKTVKRRRRRDGNAPQGDSDDNRESLAAETGNSDDDDVQIHWVVDDDESDRWPPQPSWRRRPAGAVLGPREPVDDFSGILNSAKVKFWLLPLVFFLVGWVAKDTLSTLSLSTNHVLSELDKDYRLHKEKIQAERDQWDLERKKWAEESEAREQVRLVERKLELERRRKEEKREKEEARQQKARMRWAKPQPDPQCLRYGTRVWTAKLENIPANYNPATACYETKALIHGRSLKPDFCETDTRTGTFGTWHIDFNEAACRTQWSSVSDKGCTSEGSGKRKYEAQLENLRSGDDWKAMCSSTPVEFHGLKFNEPHSCDDRGLWGYRGVWFIEDNICR